ncbi:helix-turn-helix domain-containing protein [Streptomyces sp. NPDC101118]|uniref:helix-turn-helix domain-containing protein n=1 Tax=Streptomyces sp. NPDC101118 TaxID=3366109 RepID=UPI003818009A
MGNRVSTVLARRLGGELLRLRDAAGLTQPQAAQALSATAAKIAKMEHGWVPFRDPDVRALCELYGVRDEEFVARLLNLARLDRERRKTKGWWRNDPSMGGMAEYVAMEDAATHIRTWQLALVPGLLQSPDYIRALGVSGDWWKHPDEIETLVDLRVKRQARLWGDVPLQFHAVIWEAALRQEVGGPAVMRAQLNHLAEMARRPNVNVQVLPFRAGAHDGLAGAFNLISFAEPGSIDVAYVEDKASAVWVESMEGSAVYGKAFDRLSRASLAPRDSIDLILSISKGM